MLLHSVSLGPKSFFTREHNCNLESKEAYLSSALAIASTWDPASSTGSRDARWQRQ